MKLLPILILSFVLDGCSLSVEEYNARVKYCKDNGMKTKVYFHRHTKEVGFVDCVDEDGLTFESKEAK